MQLLLNSGKVADQKELARYCQCSEALVSGALKAASLPMELLMAYPSVGELGRPTIVKLHRLYFGLKDEQRELLVSKLTEDDTAMWKKIDAQGITRITREVTMQLEQISDTLQPKVEVDKPKAQDLIKGQVSFIRDGDNLQLKLKKLTERQADEILAYLSDYLK